MRHPKLKFVTAGLVALALVGAGGAAYAFWSGAGLGTGTAAVDPGTTTSVVVDQTSVLAPMAPGVAAQALSGHFTNNVTGATPVQVTSVTASVASVSKGGTVLTTCTASDFTITNAVMPVNLLIPVGDPEGAWSGATIAFNSTSANQDGCKGATVNIGYSIK